jgi:SAM-dependent methyltransferase
MTEDFIERDQAIMSLANNYLNFLFSLVAPYQHGDILEIGSGRGNITEMTLKNNALQIKSVSCIEPDAKCIITLKKMSEKYSTETSILEGYFPEVIPDNCNFDLIYSFNVLEHIQDDQNAINTAVDYLKPNGILFAYVPAFPILYGSMDRILRHYRRYSKKDIRHKFHKSGLKIIESRYYNFMGFWGWLINNRILKINEQKNSQVKLFDRLLPLQIKIEKKLEPFIGQNLLIIGKKE